jgi:hypothetical protein
LWKATIPLLRFEDAFKNAATSSQIDPGNREIANLVKRTKDVASA